MKENFLHFLSPVPCLVSINSEEIGNIDNEYNMELDIITKTENIYVSYTPISQKHNAMPYTFQLKTSDKISTDNEYISVIPYPENNFDIIMRPFYYYQINESRAILNETVDKYFVSIITDNISRITIFSGNTIIFNLNTPKLIEAKAEMKKNILTITGIIDDNTYYLLLINSQDLTIIYNDICHSIDMSDTEIQCYRRLSDLSSHAKVFKINLTDKNQDNYYVYDEDNKTINSHQLIPQAFLECIQINDEMKAKSYLSNNLINTNLQQFKNYFGNINQIYLNRHNVKPGKLNYTIFTDRYKNYNFLLDNNKILDIEELF